MKKTFHIADILSVIAQTWIPRDRTTWPSDQLKGILSFLTGKPEYTFLDVQSCTEACLAYGPHLQKQFPQFSEEALLIPIGSLAEMTKDASQADSRLIAIGMWTKMINGQYKIECQEYMKVESLAHLKLI